MNTERTSFSAPRPSVSLYPLSLLSLRNVRVFFGWLAAALVLLGLAATASMAGLKPASGGGTGAVLALAAQLRTARLRAAAASGHTLDGRTALPRRMMHSGALVARAATAASVVPISGGVQTYDVFNPTPAFRPLVGYGSLAALNNSSTNPPVYITALTPTNLYPVWSADETFIVFSSNRTAVGGVQPDGRFHLWAISANGGEAFQITASTGPAGGGEFFPALSRNNLTVAFTSDASSPGYQNLYALSFSYSALSAGTAAPTDLSVVTNADGTSTTPPASLTIRASTEAASAALTGFDQVQRPTFSPNDDQLIVFSAHSVNVAGNGDTYAGVNHLYFLYTSSGGFSQGNNISYPGKLTDGPAADTDPTFAPDGSYIAFASTANAGGFTRNSNNALGPNDPAAVQDPNDSQSLSSGAAATRSVFLISGGLSSTGVPFGTVPATTTANLTASGGRISLGSTGGFDDYGPAWSSFANQNQYTNPSGNFAYLAFARSTEATIAANVPHDIYFFQAATGVAQVSTETLVPETTAGNGNAAVQLNTDDNAGETSTGSGGASANPGNLYDDTYPTWSPFLSIFSIAYMSNRTVTYNSPANGNPVEVASSVDRGGTVANAQDATADYSVGGGYESVLISQVLNLDPPTLLRFSTNEVVHVQAGSNPDPVNGTPNKLAATGGQSVTLTVRLSDRESGINNTGALNGGARVYVQIKDPDSKYQDAQNQEHKVFVKDARYDTNAQKNRPLSDNSSGTANSSLGSEFTDYGTYPNVDLLLDSFPFRKYRYPSYGPFVGQTPVTYVNPRGVHGGLYPPGGNNPSNTYIFVGRDAGGTNPNTVDFGAGPTTIANGDPRLFIPWGPEYECQVVNPQFAAAGTGDTTPDNPGITVADPAGNIGDYVTPYYLAGVDDQGAYSGGATAATGTDRPVAGYQTTNTATTPGGMTTTTTTTHPAEWLQLTKVPVAAGNTQDGDANGGVLYTVTWTTPTTGSDFYVDVIAYDNAVFPNIPNIFQYAGAKTNWRIYDNVGGFSTNQSIGGNDILLVSDYALGQKFAATTFGGRNVNLNLVPKQFGTESYLTDVDVSILPNSVFAGLPTNATSYTFNEALMPFDGEAVENGLGVGSYQDAFIDDGTFSTDGHSNYQSQRYSIWRILSRGPVPASLLQSYTPTPVSQPAIADAPNLTLPAATILDAPRCVIWLSPYTGDVLADPGTLDDPGNIGSNATNPRSSTTSILTQFVENGGRLFITGQDVGSTLTQGGTVNNAPSANTAAPNFLPDVLNAELASNAGGTNVLAGVNSATDRVTGSPTYDGSVGTNGISSSLAFAKVGLSGGFFGVYAYQDNLVLGDRDYDDGAFSQIPAQRLPGDASVQGQIDTITGINNAVTAMTYSNGAGALVYHDDPYKITTNPTTGAVIPPTLPNGGTGSRVVYGAFGFEALSNDYQTAQDPDPSSDTNNVPPFDERIPPVTPRNPRPLLIHNIVSFLRTGYVTGTITQTAGTGQGGGLGIDGVTVYLRPGGVPSTRGAFSALTANGGRFTIAGIEPGTYTLVAIKPGFQRAVSNSNVSFTVEGDTTETGATLTLTPQQPGNIAGVVHDAAGNQIAGATVTFTSQDNSVTKTMLTVNGSVPANAAENYFIQNVPVTTYNGTATGPLNSQSLPEYTAAAAPDGPVAPATTPDYSKGVPVVPNTTTQPVNFTLTIKPASLAGTIVDSVSGTGIAGATVSLLGPTGAVVATQTTAAGGAYSFTGIAGTTTAMNYQVSATAPGYAANAGTQALQAGSAYTGITVPLTAIASGSITGTVTDQRTGLPLPGAIVTFTMTGGAAHTTTTGSDGTYALNAVPVGTYSGTASGPATGQAYQTSPAQPVTVTTGTVPPVNFSLVPILATLTGTVKDANTLLPLAGVTISVTDGAKNAVTTNPTPITTDAGGNYSATVSPGTYFVTASKASYVSQTSAATAFALSATVNVSFKLVSSIGTVGGLVTGSTGAALAGATVTFVPSGQTTGTSFTTTGSSTGPDGSAINYTGQLATGTYTVTVSETGRSSASQAITIKGGVFNRLDFTGTNSLPALHTFPSGIQFVSTPYDYSALGFNGLFGALNTAPSGGTPNGNRSNVAVWNPLTGAYALDPAAPADALRLGVGYWVYLKNPMPVNQQGATPTGPYVAVALGQGWNQIGVPNPAGVPITSLMFDNGSGGMITFTQAGSPQYNLVTRPLYSYIGGSSYQVLDSTSGVLAPWSGYWIYANAAATLEIPTK